MMSLSADKSADIIDVFNIKFRYLDDSMNINDIYFDIWQVKFTLQNAN